MISMMCNKHGQSLIHFACYRGEIDIIRYLYEECKVSINTKDTMKDHTPLLWAAMQGVQLGCH